MSSALIDEEKECFINPDGEVEEDKEDGGCEIGIRREAKISHVSSRKCSVDEESDGKTGCTSIGCSSVPRCKSVEVIPEMTNCVSCTINNNAPLSKSVNNIREEMCAYTTCLNNNEKPKTVNNSQKPKREIEGVMCPHNHAFRPCPVPTAHPPYSEQYPAHCNDNENNGFVAVTLQHLNGHILPVRTENDPVYIAMQQQQQQQQIRGGYAYETSHNSDSEICRICHSVGDEKLIAPCKCSGSSRYVHEPCLVTWFKKSVKNECELCRSEVKIKKINHSLTRWRKPEDRPIPLIWFSVFFIGLFLNILSIHVNASEYCKSTACLIFYIVNGFGIILDSAFLYFWFLKCRHYCKKWFALNQDWFIDNLDSSNDITAVEYVRSDSHNRV